MILVVDNYDSFTYNLVQYMGEVTQSSRQIVVYRNDSISIPEIRALKPQHIVISPGPCTPNEAGISVALVSELAGEIPILGVCLGHQAIGQAFGGAVVRADRVVHGKTSSITHNGEGVFAGLENPFIATRYHSLVVEQESLPDCLEATAWSTEPAGSSRRPEIMALRHKKFQSVVGVQFHPESILTTEGKHLLANFLKM